jgi:VanZ family protein
MARFHSARWLVFAWAVLIFCISSIPGRDFPDVSVLHHDKVLHGVLYAPLGALFVLALHRSARVPTLLLILIAVAATGLYGITDEFHQRFVPGRSADRLDVLADFVGGTLGACAAWIGTRFVGSSRRDANEG